MTSILGIVSLVFIAIVGKYLVDYLRVDNLVLHFLNYSGFFYFLLGFLAGPHAFNVIEQDVIDNMNIFFLFILGWTGLLVGLQLKFKTMRRFPIYYYSTTLFHYLVALTSILGFLLLLRIIIPLSIKPFTLLIIAIAMSLTSVTLMAMLPERKSWRARDRHFLQFMAAFDNIIAIVMMGLAMVIIKQNPYTNTLIALLTVVVISLIFKYLNENFKSLDEESLLIISSLFLLVGVASYLQQSILFFSMVLGIILVNIKVDSRKLFLAIQQWEKSLHFILFFAAGILIDVKSYWFALLALIMLLITGIGKIFAAYMSNHFLRLTKQNYRLRGILNLGLGGLTLAVILEAHLLKLGLNFRPILFLVGMNYFLINMLVVWVVSRQK